VDDSFVNLATIITSLATALLSSSITGTISHLVGLKQRRLTVFFANKKDLEDFICDADEYVIDAERLIDLTQEIHGETHLSRQSVDTLFQLHSVDSTASTPKFMQRASHRISQDTVEKQKISLEKRRDLFLFYKRLLFAREPDTAETTAALQNLIGEVYVTTALAVKALTNEISTLNATLGSLRSG
jgi:hypothetical protein